MSRSLFSTQRLCGMALMSAIAFLVLLVMRIPLFPAASFLDYEGKDVIFAVAGMMYGPVGGIIVTVSTCLLELITVSHTGWIGLIMNIVSSLSFMLPVALLYQRKRTVSHAMIGLVLGAVLSCGVMLLWNAFLTPLYMGVPRSAVVQMLVPVFLPFNLIKGGLNAGLTFLLWHIATPLLTKARLLPAAPQRTVPLWHIILPTALLLTGSIVAVWLLQ